MFLWELRIGFQLTGRNLEKYDSKALDDVFQQLEAAKSGVSGSALILLNSVIALRKENWGQASSNESTTRYKLFN